MIRTDEYPDWRGAADSAGVILAPDIWWRGIGNGAA